MHNDECRRRTKAEKLEEESYCPNTDYTDLHLYFKGVDQFSSQEY